jgi:hypothetical protein
VIGRRSNFGIAPAAASHYIGRGIRIMRAEITAIVEDIKQSLGLLRRHL